MFRGSRRDVYVAELIYGCEKNIEYFTIYLNSVRWVRDKLSLENLRSLIRFPCDAIICFKLICIRNKDF